MMQNALKSYSTKPYVQCQAKNFRKAKVYKCPHNWKYEISKVGYNPVRYILLRITTTFNIYREFLNFIKSSFK